MNVHEIAKEETLKTHTIHIHSVGASQASIKYSRRHYENFHQQFCEIYSDPIVNDAKAFERRDT